MKTVNYNISWFTGTSRGTLETTDPMLAGKLHNALSMALGHEPHVQEVMVNVPPLTSLLGPELPGFGIDRLTSGGKPIPGGTRKSSLT